MNKSLGIFKDNIINVDYNLSIVESAKSLANTLKTTLKKLKVDFAKYNSDNESDGEPIDNTPIEIYEYQNFFILEKSNGDIVLLDGFRRLLWYNAPETPILVRTYKESDLKPQEILTLLVNLNHFKFFGGSDYHDRGFALLLKTVFDVDITTFRRTFDAYLSSDKIKNDYGSSYGNPDGEEKIDEIKKRITNEFFLSDIKFLETLSKTDYLCDQYMGALIYQNRLKSKTEFDVKKFLESANAHKVLQELTVKYKKIGTNNSAKSHEIVNKILEIYQNIFKIMDGGEVEVSFAEKQKEAKDMVAILKKDKSLIKLTGNQNCYKVERVMEQYLKDKKPLEFECVIHPKDFSSGWNNHKHIKIPHGIIKNVIFIKSTASGHGPKTQTNFGFKTKGGDEFIIYHNYGDYFSTGKKYTHAVSKTVSTSYDIDLFVRIPKSEIPE